MADMIGRKKLIDWFSAYIHYDESIPPETVIADIKAAPAVDAVPVVRCKDCIGNSTWYNDAEYGCAICGLSGLYLKNENDYCSYGERKYNG